MSKKSDTKVIFPRKFRMNDSTNHTVLFWARDRFERVSAETAFFYLLAMWYICMSLMTRFSYGGWGTWPGFGARSSTLVLVTTLCNDGVVSDRMDT